MKAADIKRATCVDGGVIGSSWAIQFAMHRLAMTLYNINDEQLKGSETQMHRSSDVLEQLNVITLERRGEIVAATRLATSMEEAVADAQFIQENDPGRLGIKQSTLARVGACAAADALYVSLASGLLISDIIAKATHPERCVGTHPYNPPHLIPLAELTFGDKTDPALLRLAHDFYQSTDREAIFPCRECSGFTASRLQLVPYREVQDLVMRGVCFVEGADKALVYGPSLRWTIFGHNMIMQPGNSGGLTGMVNTLDDSGDRRLADTASWTYQSDNWAEIAQSGADEEMKHFPDHTGHTSRAYAVYRDQMLIELLKSHKKL